MAQNSLYPLWFRVRFRPARGGCDLPSCGAWRAELPKRNCGLRGVRGMPLGTAVRMLYVGAPTWCTALGYGLICAAEVTQKERADKTIASHQNSQP